MKLRLLSLLVLLSVVWLSISCSTSYGGKPENAKPGLSGSTADPHSQSLPEPPATVRIIVTADCGHKLLLDTTAKIDSSTSAMEALKQVARVETRYGGGFVQDIDGARTVHSLGAGDWFFYINGMQARTGATGYTLQPGDVERWDFHQWGFRTFVPAIIGNFPEPFLHGYDGRGQPTTIVFEHEFQTEAKAVAELLTSSGVKAYIQNVAELEGEAKKFHNLILIGTAEAPLIRELNQAWDRLGFFARFDGGELVTYDNSGGITARYGSETGLIEATQSPWNPKGTGACENVVWVISGTDAPGVRDAIEVLVDQTGKVANTFAIAVTEDRIVRLPFSLRE